MSTGTPAPERQTRASVWRWVVLVGLLAAVISAVGIPARATYGAQVSGDEPYYLLTAQSLISDGDLDISDQIASGAYRAYHDLALDEQTVSLDTSGRRVSPHDPLLSVLLAPAMALPAAAAWPAAKGLLAIVAGLTAGLTCWTAVRRFDVSAVTAGIVVGAAFGGIPLANYGSQVYPEMPAALLVVAIVATGTAPSLRWGHLAAIAAAVVALPWLSVKFTPVAGVLILTLLWRLWRDGRRRDAGAVVGFLAVAGVLYLVAHQLWYGGWTVYAAGDHFVADGEFSVVGVEADYAGRTRRLVGLLVDRGYGLAAWSPLWLLAPAAVTVAGLRRHRSRTWLLVPIAVGWSVATWVALTMHGWWSPGRQVVVVAPLIVVALAVAVDAVRSRRTAHAVVLLAGLAGAVNWATSAVEAATGGPVLIVDFEESAAPVRRLLAPLLPDGVVGGLSADALLLAWFVGLVLTAVVAGRVLGHRRSSVAPDPAPGTHLESVDRRPPPVTARATPSHHPDEEEVALS
ncbi:hypothetical protein [Euzebya tangerina]|uniref:hypothetical protein n=1 Tax=Euzebya tangerina TaxID=591198 RepID=UPI0013C2A56A|nr:hypothetical protein [Euzebya tangerina]